MIIPKDRRKVFFGKRRRPIGAILRELCRQRGIGLLKGPAMPDHVPMCLSIPPKDSVAETIGLLTGQSAVRIHRELLRERRMTGLHFWAAGYCVSTVGLDEARVRQYSREQEALEILWCDEAGVAADTCPGYGYAREGQPASMEVPKPHLRIDMISAISNGGMVRFMTDKGGVDAAWLILLLRRPVRTMTRKVDLIVDWLQAHRAKPGRST